MAGLQRMLKREESVVATASVLGLVVVVPTALERGVVATAAGVDWCVVPASSGINWGIVAAAAEDSHAGRLGCGEGRHYELILCRWWSDNLIRRMKRKRG